MNISLDELNSKIKLLSVKQLHDTSYEFSTDIRYYLNDTVRVGIDGTNRYFKCNATFRIYISDNSIHFQHERKTFDDGKNTVEFPSLTELLAFLIVRGIFKEVVLELNTLESMEELRETKKEITLDSNEPVLKPISKKEYMVKGDIITFDKWLNALLIIECFTITFDHSEKAKFKYLVEYETKTTIESFGSNDIGFIVSRLVDMKLVKELGKGRG